MVKTLRKSLEKFHELFEYTRRSGFQLEELIVLAIKSDNRFSQPLFWDGPSHSDKADITIEGSGKQHLIEVKSGQIVFAGKENEVLDVSGHRLGRFKEDKEAITDYLLSKDADYISTSYMPLEDDRGRTHHYQLRYIPIDILKPDSNEWIQDGSQWVHTNQFGVRLSIRPSMSWQIWWRIPTSQIEKAKTIVIN